MFHRFRFQNRTLPLASTVWLISLGFFASSLVAEDTLTPEQLAFFEKKIRPTLVKECYECHSAQSDELAGGLAVDSRAGLLRGGDTGPAVTPGSIKESLLVKAIHQSDDDLQMPPDNKLSAATIADFETWIKSGAPDPRDGPAASATQAKIDIESGRKFWSFQKPTKTNPPAVKDTAWPKSDIDRYLLARLETAGLKPVADADPFTLVRRLYFDLIGLPPTPSQAGKFVMAYHTNPEQAVASTIDELLASPRFGERWGRHWLDVARFGESSGQSANFAYPQAWRYRDWVIDAFNNDMPYDDFIRAQLAGDLLPSSNANDKAANQIATGFLAIGPKSLNERNRRQFQLDVVDEQIDATFQAFQGLTVACARCHDHKFDPIEQRDYYALAGIFRSTETCYGTVRFVQNNHPSSLIELPEETNQPNAIGKLNVYRRASLERQIEAAKKQRDETEDRTRRIFIISRISLLESEIKGFDKDGDAKALAMGVRERPFAFDSALFVRGEPDQPQGTVRRSIPQVLSANPPTFPRRSSGRKELADFIASKNNPLTARVMANRVWLHMFGRGLVTTPDNFGAAGQFPSHPELLDYLAISLTDNNWSIKSLIKTIAMSRAYQLSTSLDATNFKTDPENELVWRVPLRRLEAEALRDAMLQVSGMLETQPPVGSPVARNGEGNLVRAAFLRSDPSLTDTHRSVYLPVVRDQPPEMLSVFDFPDASLIIGQRAITTIPAQSLFMMNNTGVIKLAARTGDALAKYGDSDEDRIRQAYALFYTRRPDDSEMNAALYFLSQFQQTHSERATWAAFCQALFAGAEFAHR